MTQPYFDDPFATANNPPVLSGDLYGKVQLDAWYCVLEKGYGRVPFDPQTHEQGQKRTAIDITIEPLPELGITNPNVCERHLLAESKPWRNITLASLRDLGIQDVRTVNGKWAHIVPEPTGGTYQKNGETKNETMFKFVAIFENEDACRKAYSDQSGGQPATQPALQPASNGNSGNQSERETAKAFLPTIINTAIAGKQSSEHREAISQALAGFPMVSKFFTYDSPEVQDLLPPPF